MMCWIRKVKKEEQSSLIRVNVNSCGKEKISYLAIKIMSFWIHN